VVGEFVDVPPPAHSAPGRNNSTATHDGRTYNSGSTQTATWTPPIRWLNRSADTQGSEGLVTAFGWNCHLSLRLSDRFTGSAGSHCQRRQCQRLSALPLHGKPGRSIHTYGITPKHRGNCASTAIYRCRNSAFVSSGHRSFCWSGGQEPTTPAWSPLRSERAGRALTPVPGFALCDRRNISHFGRD